jgi:hypothetical protein
VDAVQRQLSNHVHGTIGKDSHEHLEQVGG